MEGIPARVSLGDGEGVSYAFAIPTQAEYVLRTLGLGQRFACRLEAAGGEKLEGFGILPWDAHVHFEVADGVLPVFDFAQAWGQGVLSSLSAILVLPRFSAVSRTRSMAASLK